MDEQKTNERSESQSPIGNNLQGIQSEANEKVKQLNEETERLNRAIAEHENAKARAALGGVSVLTEQKPREETPQEYAKRVLSGKI